MNDEGCKKTFNEWKETFIEEKATRSKFFEKIFISRFIN